MDQNSTLRLDADQFRRVWRRVMPTDRPDCPFTLDPPLPAPAPPMPLHPPAPMPQRREPPLYLGEDCAGDLPTLARLLCLTEESRMAYRALKNRRGRGREALPGKLHTAKENQLRRLGAVYFLIAGERCDLPGSGEQVIWASLPLAVRDCYRREQRAALRFFTAANSVCSPQLIDLCREIGREDQAHAEQLRAWLEQI